MQSTATVVSRNGSTCIAIYRPSSRCRRRFQLVSERRQHMRQGTIWITGAEGNQIAIHFTTRSPADLLPPSNTPKLLVASYAWDGNSFPGNEYWQGMLSASGHPAAACCSTIAELQNAWINVRFLDRHYLIHPVKLCTS